MAELISVTGLIATSLGIGIREPVTTTSATAFSLMGGGVWAFAIPMRTIKAPIPSAAIATIGAGRARQASRRIESLPPEDSVDCFRIARRFAAAQQSGVKLSVVAADPTLRGGICLQM